MSRLAKSLFRIAVLWLLLAPAAALAAKRVALVIGNGAYSAVPRLPNPARDAEAMAAGLRSGGFDSVDLLADLDRAALVRALRTFEEKARGADIGLIFFAGHGLEAGGQNYLIPVDAKLGSERDAEDEAVPLERVLRTLEGVTRLRLVILDACRDNPFAATMQRTNGSRGISRGLGRVEPSGAETLVAFAARAGTTAADGTGGNSPFTAALLRHLLTPGLDIRLALGEVRDDVINATARTQEPFVYGSLGGGVLALNPVPQAVATPAGDAAADYALAERIGTAEAWNAFLARYPQGFYAELAIAARTKLPGNAPKTRPAGEVASLSPDAPAKPSGVPTSPQQVCRQRGVGAQGADIYCASSVLPSQFGNSYGVENLFGSADQAWVPNSRGPAIDEWITIQIGNAREIRQIAIANGYQKNSDIFGKNSRVREIEVRSPNNPPQTFRLEDRMGTQVMVLATPVKPQWLQIVIKAVYPGSKFPDTAISKLSLN